MESSDIILRADGVPFRYVVFVESVELEKPKCDKCQGSGKTGSGWLDDDIETCSRCQGRRTIRTLRFVDYELEAHLKVCMDEYIKRKFPHLGMIVLVAG